MTTHAYDQAGAAAYNGVYRASRFQIEDRIVARHLSRAFAPGRTIVDLGCGTGALIDLIDVPMYEYLGYDLSHHMVTEARYQHPGYWFSQADITKLPPDIVASAPVDVYLGWGVLNEVSDPAAVLSLTAKLISGKRATSDSGVAVILAATNAGVGASPIYQQHGTAASHVFTSQSLTDLAGDAGLIGTVRGITRWHHRAAGTRARVLSAVERPVNRVDPDGCMYLMLTAAAR